jgi:hypothetical protein
MGCLPECVRGGAAVPQIADDLPQRPRRQLRAITGNSPLASNLDVPLMSGHANRAEILATTSGSSFRVGSAAKVPCQTVFSKDFFGSGLASSSLNFSKLSAASLLPDLLIAAIARRPKSLVVGVGSVDRFEFGSLAPLSVPLCQQGLG